MTLHASGPSARALLLEPLISAERMVPYDPWDHWARRPDLPAEARVEIMDDAGTIRRWEFADLADWHEAVAYRTAAGELLECYSCGDWTMSAAGESELGCFEDCYAMGER